MEGEDSSGSVLYRPRMEAENQGGDGIAAAAELLTVDECEPIDEMDDSQLVGVPVMVAEGSVAGGKGALAAVDVEVRAEVKVKETDGVKRKRGRPPRGQAKPPPLKKKREEEDVCFICFDGGSLVLCDRRGCPKAYHPACIKRDEAFFRSRAKWNCGWHICSICQKAAHYMCYTCTYSLCKACTKDADYLCARENKGFCTVCMRTIMLIENNDQGNKEMAQVDFDDKSSWEYLFKVYWIYLKGKLSLTLDELTQAKNPWKAAGTMACKGQSSHMHYGGNDVKGSVLDNPSGHLDANDSKRRRTKEQPKLPNNEDSLSTGKSSSDRGTTSTRFTEWASKELLELVVHMKNGDTSVLSQFDVQALLLDYIKRNNLRDPRRKSQIICDSRLKILFGKSRVGHFEMLKLLEFHFLIKEDVRKDVIQGNIVDAILSQVEGGGNNENLLMMGKDKKRKPRRKGEERGPQTNLDEYAAIDVHNINLIYLRRNLMESLIADKGRFHDKIVGSIVRIRISNSDQKQDMYRLVQVVGTCKVAVPYKISEKTTDVMLEILNLDKKESISIDLISNQEFSKDECRRLRQSIKCGLVKRLTVGQIQEKAIALQEVRLNDWLETEVLRLNHLRDRASEKGHKKELRECVEKLELLKTPEERQRRLHEIPEVHADSNMDPNCESDGDAGEVSNKKQDEYVKPRYSGFSRNGREPISPRNGDSSYDSGCRGWKKLTTSEQSRTMSTKFYMDKGAPSRVVERVNESSWHEGKDACGSNSSDKPGNHVDSSGSVVGGWNSQAVLRSGSFSGGASETSIASLSTGSAPSANDSETDKLWHYRDPNGKIQGPFCMVQLRKWSTTGYFPPDMTIWSINDEEDDSFLLTDVLDGKFHKVLPLRYNISFPSQDVKVAYDSRLYYCDDRRSVSMNPTRIDRKLSDGGWNCVNAIAHTNVNNEFVKGDVWSSHSTNWTTAVVNNNDVQTGISSQCWDSLKVNNSHSDQPHVHCQLSSSTFIKQENESSLHQGSGLEGEGWNPGPNHGNWSSHGNTIQATNEQSHENRSDSQAYSGQSPGESWRTLPVNFSSNSSFASVAKSTDSSEQNLEIDIPNLPSPTPNTGNEDLEGQTTKDQQSVPSKVPVQDSGIQKLPSSPARKPSAGDLESQPTKDQQSVPSKVPVQDSGMQKLPSPTPKPSDGDEKADSTIQNLPNPLPKPMDGDKTDSSVQNLPSPPPKPMVGDEKVDSSVQNMPSPPPKPMVGDEKVDSSVQNLPSPPPKPMLGDKKVDSSIQNLPSPPPKPMDVDEKVDSSIQNLPSPSPKSSDGDEKVQATENKPPVSSNVPVQDSESSWSSASSLVVGGGTLPETADAWGGYSPTCAKPSVKEWDSGLVSVASLNLPEVASDYAVAPTSNCDQLTPPSPSHPATNSSGWQAVVTEPFEFSTLAEESVSDLLAEVDAMESQCGLASATSVMDSDEELFQDSKNDCFTSIGGLSPPLDSGKSDALSSTGDMALPYQSTITDEPIGASPANVLDPVQRSGGQSSTGAEVKVETQPTDISVNQSEADSNSQLPASSTFSRDMVHTNTAHRAGLKPMNTGWGTMQGNMNLGLGGGSTQGIPNLGWGTGLGTARGNVNMNGSASAGFKGWENQPRYGGERFIGPRDWAFQSGDSGFGRGRASWSRQSSYGYGGGGNYTRPPPKGQRVCKFYESGHCKKGAFCDYLHPS